MANDLQNKLDAILADKNANLLPENLRKGITLLGVNGILEEGSSTPGDGPMKLFETVEKMNADTNPKENDLALVYRSEIRNANVDSKFQTATFPDTVVLPQAVTGYVSIMYRSVDSSIMFDCYGTLDSSMFSMDCWSDTGSVRISYNSSDGITYTRVDDGEETIDFGTEIYFDDRYGEFDDNIGYFIQVGGNVFDGIYQYNNYKTDDFAIYDVENYTYDETNNALIVPELNIRVKKSDVYDATIALRTLLGITAWGFDIFVSKDYNKIILCVAGPSQTTVATGSLFLTDNKLYYGRNTDITHYVRMFEYTIATKQIIQIELPTETVNFYYSSTRSNKAYRLDAYPIGECISDNQYERVILNYYENPAAARTLDSYHNVLSYIESIYKLAPTQLTLSNANELSPGEIAYGKNGIIEGDGSIYNNSELLTPLMISNSLGNYEISIYPSNSKEVGSKYVITNSTVSETNMSIIFNNYLYRNFDYSNNYNNNIIVDNETGLSLRFYKYDDYYIVFDCSNGSNYKYVKLNSNQKQLGVIDKPASVLGKPLGYNNLLFHMLRDSESGSSNYKITVIDLNTMTQVSTIRFAASTMYTSSVRLTVYNDTLYCCWTDTSNGHLHGVTTSLTSLTEEMTATETVSYTGKQLYSYSNAILNKKYFIVRNKTGDGTNVIDITTNKLYKTWSVNVGVSDTVRVYNEDKTKVLTGYESYIVNLTDMSISSSKYTVPTSGYTMQSIYNTNYILSLTKSYLYEFDWTTLTFKTIFSHPYGGGYSVRFPFEDVITYEPNKYVVLKSALGKAIIVSALKTSDDDYDIRVISGDSSNRESLVTDIFSSNLILDKLQTVSSSYNGTISPAEYNEINEMAEDILGGVE